MRNKAYRCKKIYEACACCTMRGRDWVARSERRNSTFHYLQIIKKLLYYYIYDLYIYIQAFWVLIFEEKFRLPFFFGEFKTRSRSRNFIISTVSRFY